MRPVLALLLLLSTRAGAQVVDPDTQAARRHYDLGAALYEKEQYDQAIVEFEKARDIKAAPALDYNIGRCHDRRERWKQAADAYERYLKAAPSAPEAAQLAERIVLLRARERKWEPERPLPAALPERPQPAPDAAKPSLIASAPPPARRPVYKRGWFWGVLAASAAVVATGIALGVTLGAAGDTSRPLPDVQF